LNRLVITGDGSHTIYVPELDEHYHSVHGAIRESGLVFIRNGFESSKADPVKVFEVGFGTGLNAFLTFLHSEKTGRKTGYTSIENFPVDKEIYKSLNYPDLTDRSKKDLFNMLHECEWGLPVPITANFTLTKIRSSLLEFKPAGTFDVIYFDAFGPDKQPEMWSDKIIKKISELSTRNSIFVTYSVKGEVKRSLRSHGFVIELLPGPPGKRHVMRAIKSEK
jgi:tRNA U34 5-methylaminomethyl-2-thiouridine-forming methyltransferase MnmC